MRGQENARRGRQGWAVHTPATVDQKFSFLFFPIGSTNSNPLIASKTLDEREAGTSVQWSEDRHAEWSNG